MGKIYRSAALQPESDKDTAVSPSSRGARCIRCGTSGYNAGYGGGYGTGGYGGDR